MSGHSKWSTIKRKKAANDAKKGKAFTQLIREVTMAARMGGGEIDSNPRLRLAVDKARTLNMPKDNIERAIKKGTGELEGEALEEIRYEGYGPAGVAIIVDALTDNRNRTVGEVRHAFSKHGGNLGSSGCVAYLFDKLGVLEFDRAGANVDALIEAAIEADARDVIEDEDTIRVQTAPEDLHQVKQALEKAGFESASADIQMLPQALVEISGQEAETALKLMDVLDDHEDVKQVFANFDVVEDQLLEAAKAG